MDALLLSIRCLLALVFLVAAFGKFFDLEGSRRALKEFGVPERIARLGGLALPIAELGVGIALLIRPSARWGAAGAILLLTTFIVGLAHSISKGRAPDCHCFGQIHSEPAGRSTLLRNVIFAAAALIILIAGSGPSIDAGLASLNGTQVALVATSTVAAALALTTGQLWSDKRRLARELAQVLASRAPAGLPRGTPAPDFALTPVRGTARSLGELLDRARPTVLVFVSTGCSPCLQMLPSLASWQQSLGDSLTLATIFSGEATEIERLSDEHELSTALAQETNGTFVAYQLRATPSGVLVDRDGVIAAAPAEGMPAIEALIRSAVAESAPAGVVVLAG